MIKLGYVIGALKNTEIPKISRTLRDEGYEVMDDWFAAGPEADVIWREYEIERGRPFSKAINGIHAEFAFNQDKTWLDKCDFAVLVLPAGKSGHLELGYVIGQGKPGWILMDGEPERYDLMYKFARIAMSMEDLLQQIKEEFNESE